MVTSKVNGINLSFCQTFHHEYLRNNKANGGKNLRCFPCCAEPAHKLQGFCGQSVIVDLIVNSNTIPVPDGKKIPHPREWLIIGEFQPLNNEYSPIQAPINESEILRNSFSTSQKYFFGKKVVISSAEEEERQNQVHLQVRFESRPWLYAWHGNRFKRNVQHAFIISILTSFEAIEMDNSNEATICELHILGQFASPSFFISSMRRNCLPIAFARETVIPFVQSVLQQKEREKELSMSNNNSRQQSLSQQVLRELDEHSSSEVEAEEDYGREGLVTQSIAQQADISLKTNTLKRGRRRPPRADHQRQSKKPRTSTTKTTMTTRQYPKHSELTDNDSDDHDDYEEDDDGDEIESLAKYKKRSSTMKNIPSQAVQSPAMRMTTRSTNTGTATTAATNMSNPKRGRSSRRASSSVPSHVQVASRSYSDDDEDAENDDAEEEEEEMIVTGLDSGVTTIEFDSEDENTMDSDADCDYADKSNNKNKSCGKAKQMLSPAFNTTPSNISARSCLSLSHSVEREQEQDSTTKRGEVLCYDYDKIMAMMEEDDLFLLDDDLGFSLRSPLIHSPITTTASNTAIYQHNPCGIGGAIGMDIIDQDTLSVRLDAYLPLPTKRY